jgi:hypothetical protein
MTNKENEAGKPDTNVRFQCSNTRTSVDLEYLNSLEKYFGHDNESTIEKLQNFPKYAPEKNLISFLSKNEIFKKILNIHGAVVECGVLFGGGLMTWAHCSSIYEPINLTRKIIGFDTFEGFTGAHSKDSAGDLGKKGDFASHSYEDLQECVKIFDMLRFKNHVQKVELVKGDFLKTSKQYLEDNPHLVIALLFLDFDIYEPTKAALDLFLDRVPKGGVIAFDHLYYKGTAGETVAAYESMGLSKYKVERFYWDPLISYIVKS